MTFKQANRNIKLFTPLGEDAINLVGFHGQEEISGLFQFSLQLLSKNADIEADQLIGKSVSFSVVNTEGSPRFFNGYVRRFSSGDVDAKGRRTYSMELVPWLWFLTQRTDCRAFLDKTIVEIFEQVFNELGFRDYETSKIEGEHPKRDYCVQYRETDFDFISRLMEEEGIFYYFRHENNKHVMVLADSRNGYSECSQASVDCPQDDHATRHFKPHFKHWSRGWQFRPGKVARTDYNFLKSKQDLMTEEKTLMKYHNVDKFQTYDYPGNYGEKGFGGKLTRIRMEEQELDHDKAEATSTVSAFSPGNRFSIGKHRQRNEEGKGYVIRRIQHSGTEETYETGGGDGGFEYSNQVECFSDQTTFRAQSNTETPVIESCQMAVVVGPEGEEIFTDENGRVKVKFPWMRRGETSFWVRVSQAHAGSNWGYIDLPRIGEEVLVQFMNGDPDYPVIIGRVYNDMNKPPFDLPAQKTRRGNKTKTYKGAGYNEMSMDDTAGKEQIRVHAQYNMDTEIKHDETHIVHNDRTRKVGKDEKVDIGANQTLTVGKDQSVTIADNHTLKVGKNQSIKIGADQETNIGGAQKLIISGNSSTDCQGSLVTKVGTSSSHEAGTEIKIKAGMTLTIEAGAMLEIKCGASKISMNPAMVTITGPIVKINC